ncbi:MAG: UPF0182 family protein [Actinomycetota bacterium]|nr:UPF0182 family protein [Actinomycetota bacterium]
MRTPADLPRRLPRTSRRFRIGVLAIVVVAILLLTSLRGLARFWTDYLWFSEVHFTSVFRGVLLTKIALAVVFIAIFFVMLFVSLTVADRVAPAVPATGPDDDLVDRYREIQVKRGRLIRLGVSLVFALFAGVGANKEWNNWDLFRYHASFPTSDAQFHKNVGFYVFQLPFIQWLLNWVFLAIVVVLIVTAVAHYLNGGIRFQSPSQRSTTAVKTHVSVLLGILSLVKGVDYYFQRLEIVLSRKHLVDGATATGVHAEIPAKFLLITIAVVAAAMFLYNIRQRGWTLPIVAVVVWALVWVLVGGVYPAAYQALRVSPSELTRESPYLQRNIDGTRAAYGLSNVAVTQTYKGNATLDPSQIEGTSPQAVANQQTLANVRLLDPQQVGQTFDKYQALRSYYQFQGLDTDRYSLGGALGNQMTQVITSVRELFGQNVPSGFVNTHLEYTHGYGAAVAPASQAGVNPDGTPNFSLQNIPPVGTPALSANGSQMYFGEGASASGYVVANSKQAELDFENSTGAQVSNHYAGTGGVAAGTLVRRLAFALRFGDPNMVLSGQLSSSSRVMYIRNIADRVRKAAPFLKYDTDPYAVLLNDRTYWVQDAYTTTNNYPYSQEANTNRVDQNSGLASQFNYVRNSVKVVISAYDGSMKFFVMNTNDPIIKVYEKAFPDLFTPVAKADTMIPGITAHWRYPADLFRVQTNMYGRYHLTKAADFYSQAQAWTISQDPGSGNLGQTQLATALTQNNVAGGGIAQVPTTPRLQPEYLLAHLPNSTQQRFLSLQPFEPVSSSTKQQNLTAFMTASADPNDYGQLSVFETPPQDNVDGPALITNAIKSNTAISSELSLLNQGSSEVVLGQVEAIPIDQTLLYVQPIYVQSSSNQVPTVKDVVVVYNGTAYNSGNASLDAALCKVTNSDGSQPFSMYCGTSAATASAQGPGAGAGGNAGGGGTTTTTTPGSTAPPTTSPSTTPPAGGGGQTVQSLLGVAQTQFAAAMNALRSGNLAAYQQAVTAASNAVNQAAALAGKPTGATTTTPPTTAPPPTSPPPTSPPPTSPLPTTIPPAPA